MNCDFSGIRKQIEYAVRKVLGEHVRGFGRGSEARIVPALRDALGAMGFDASSKHRLSGPISLGRDPKTLTLRPALSWTEADIAIVRDGMLVGIVESEHDLAWVVQNGGETPGSTAAWRYTMSSIACDPDGVPYTSYAPLERMAYVANWQGTAATTAAVLERIRSSERYVHNPRGLPFFLVCEVADERHRALEARISSLGVDYIEPT